jgi:DNA polymerase-1
MNRLSTELKGSSLKAKVLLQVHDELVLEVDRSDLMETAALVKATMENAATLKVPIAVELGYGENWDDMTDLVV